VEIQECSAEIITQVRTNGSVVGEEMSFYLDGKVPEALAVFEAVSKAVSQL
jgi:hypothetical protein